ncbi:MAG: cell division protein FtsQ/DivIB [Aestuariivita sp.]|nr:cell division protein FtsQ/DivIB [Aestuariivita sp.]
MKAALPVGAIIGIVFYLIHENYWINVEQFLRDLKYEIVHSPGLMVHSLTIEGASDDLAHEIRDVLPLEFPVSSFDLDLDYVRNLIIDISRVKSAGVHLQNGGTLSIEVVEFKPAVVWRNSESIQVLDAAGTPINTINSRQERVDLPLIAGENADKHVTEALQIFATAVPWKSRLRGLVRIGERRWDIILDKEQKILLPSLEPVQALERVISMNETSNLFDRDILLVDMRIPDRPTVRISQEANKVFLENRKNQEEKN